MPTPNDDLFIWTLNHMPMEVVNLSLQLDLNTDVNQLSTDGTDHIDSIFFSRGPLATLRTTVLLFVIERCLPHDQRWLFYWLMVYSRQNLVRQVYVMAYAEIFLLWYFPVLPPRIMYLLNLVLDVYLRSTGASYGVFQDEVLRTFGSQIRDLIIGYYLLQYYTNLESLTGWLELLLGPASFWPWAIFPILPGLLAIDEGAPLNAFTPERSEGLVMAAALWGCTKLLPKWIQWALWPIYSAPDHNNRGMTSKWVLCTLLWMWFDTPVLVAYGLHLFANQFPQIEFALRQEGGGPSRILRRERYGWACFISMSFLLRFVEVSGIGARADLHFLGLTLWAWVLHIPIIALGIGLLQKKLSARRATFKHKPVRGSNQIRLLRVRPRYLSKNQQMHCDMVHVDLTSPPQYTAISYRWGLADEEPLFIMIDDAPFPIFKSLYTLLLAKRKSRHHVLFWIDAICINQSDDKEKSQQVNLMRRIFEEASSTIGWLGDNPGAGKAMDLVQRINQAPDRFFSQTLQQESDSGWKELSELVANSWFQRVWIIQEIAVAKSPRVRYGKQELEWKELVNALSLIVAHGPASGVPDDLLHSHYIVNALDVLKLGAIFQATLPVDKVFALLSIAEERNRSLLSLDYSADVPDLEVWHAKNLFHDLYRTVDTINDIKGTISGLRNSRRSQTVLSSPNGPKYFKLLLKDMNRILQDLQWLARKRKKISPERPEKYDVLRPEYSKQTTPESVYSLVAKVAVVKGNVHSIIRHAGIGLSRNKDLQNLPSWVPDWSSTLDTCILPSRIPRSPRESQIQDPGSVEGKTTVEKSDEESHPVEAGAKGVKNGEPISYESIRDASFGFHYVRGQSCGRIRHLATLSEDVAGNSTGDSADIIEAARLAFQSQISNYTKALSVAQQFCHDRYKTREAIESAFFRTILADVGGDGCTPASEREVTRCKSWVYGVRDDCRVAVALRRPEESLAYWTQVPGAHDPDTMQSIRKHICAKYFVHPTNAVFGKREVRTYEDPKAGSTIGSMIKDRHLSFFDDKNTGPLAAYGEYIDYTLGRRLAITDSGHMGLVPWGAQEGDIVVHSSSEKLCLLLRRSKPHELCGEGFTGRQKTSRPEEMFRLVGEAYIHDLNNSEDETKKPEERLFKMW
ncbi:Heterokaryon incompatibility protein (HET) domain containing protein [Hyaloscypha variabilis]